jgi:hypothetical protein
LRQAKLTSEASATLRAQTLEALRKFICSPASEAGATRFVSPDGQTIDRAGREAALASPSAPPASSKEPQTSGTYGLKCSASLRSASLQSSLESRLRAALDVNGSPEYALTWKHWDMVSGAPICALRASGRRISDNGFTGWPTPNAIPETRGGLQANPEKALERRQQGHTLNLDDAACLAPAGWATPTTRDHKDGASTLENVEINSLLGRQVSLSPALTASPDASQPTRRASLNLAFSLWLMGYRTEWARCAARVTRLSRKSRQRSSEPPTTNT